MNVTVVLQWLLATVVICLSLVYWFYQRNYAYWKLRGVPYQKPWLVFGNLGFMMRKSFPQFFYELSKANPSGYVGIFLAWKPALVIQSPQLAKQILIKDFDYFQDRFVYSEYASDPLGALNLFNVKNPIWSEMRQKLSPMFTSSRLKVITELMNENAGHLVKRVQRDHVENNVPVKLKTLFTMYTSDTVAYSVFGMQSGILDGESSLLWHISGNIIEWTFWRGFELITILFLPAIAKLMRLKFFSAKATEYIRKLFWNVVEDNKKLGLTNERNLVNHLIALKETAKIPSKADPQFADNLMIAQVAVFLTGSIETSSGTLTYLFHELAHHPEIQEKLYREIEDATKQKGKDVLDYDDLLELKFFTACINETLRKYPVLPNFDRICLRDYRLNDEVVIEKGTPVLVNLMGIHHNEKYFPQAHEWRPERFTNATSYNDNLNFSFLPFGEGPRACIGKRYGLMQIRAAAARLLLNYRVEPDSPYEVEDNPYSYPKSRIDGGVVKFIPRVNEEI